jgi:DNA-binding transcriptional LysR family regulator
MLDDGTVDVILAREIQHPLAKGFAQEELLQDPVVVVCGTHHPLAKKRKIEWRDLAGVPWILPLRGSPTFALLEVLLERHGLTLPIGCIESISYSVNVTMLEESTYISLFSQSYARSYLKSPKISALNLSTDGMQRSVRLLWRRDNANPVLEGAIHSIRKQAILF